ncbi:MAG: chemotaxis protein CheB [bacterium]|nr:chemotaxis protein CheB [bacterium]
MNYRAVVFGASAGGMKAFETILPQLPAGFAFSVIVVMHRHPDADDFLERLLDGQCPLPVKQAVQGETVKPGTVYFSPPGRHLLIGVDRIFSLSSDAPVNYARPSIDVLFESAADVYGAGLIGIVLTGANNDGSLGLKKIKGKGGLAVVQEPTSAEVVQMPKAAIAAADPHHILPLEKIAPFLCSLLPDHLPPPF